MNNRQSLVVLFNAAIKSVSGQQAVRAACQQSPAFTPSHIIAVGKAASDMALGALAVYGNLITLVVTKYQHSHQALADNPAVLVIESAHPVPDANSLLAGKTLIETVTAMPSQSRLLLLVSGGASALAESLPDGMTLSQWQILTEQMLADGLNIAQINQKRKQISALKDGRLLQNFVGGEVMVLAISDVKGDDIAIIGSGIGDIHRLQSSRLCKAKIQLIATNNMARDGAQTAAIKAGFQVVLNQETLYGDVFQISQSIAGILLNPLKPVTKGIYIFGGEPTIKLPANPGNGGRNQSLALALAKRIAGQTHITILVAGTDGTDGPTDAAGAVVDGSTFCQAANAQLALDTADAGTYLRLIDDILITGPTGTNVMDLVIALVE